MFRLWIERRFSRPVTAAGAVLKPQRRELCGVAQRINKPPASLQRMNSAPLPAGGLLHSISLLKCQPHLVPRHIAVGGLGNTLVYKAKFGVIVY